MDINYVPMSIELSTQNTYIIDKLVDRQVDRE